MFLGIVKEKNLMLGIIKKEKKRKREYHIVI